jgi:pyruvate dehydrogenase E1 component beta subunit
MVLRAPTGAGVQLAATHSQSFETWLCEVPGLKCVCPSTPYDALGLIRSAIKDDNPVFVAEPAMLYSKKGEIPNEYYEVPIGKANVIKSGSDVSLFSYGHGIKIISETANYLEKNGINAELVDLRSLNPIDTITISNSVRKTNRVVLVDTARKTGGVMSEVASLITENSVDWLDGPIVTVGSDNVPWPYNHDLEKKAFVDVQSVVKAFEKGYGV